MAMVTILGPMTARKKEDDQHRRQRQLDLGEHGDHRIKAAAEVSCQKPESGADCQAYNHGQCPNGHGGPAPHHHAAENVAAQFIGPEYVVERSAGKNGRLQARREVHSVWRVRGQPGGKET
ncbi:hypothetical protein IV417_16175 [Alphaproteobacteria bacterium KMM 3653]|uniref:Uncharacterized protein n=1 Tax=Harenicola maris TaxID=2841044 RepID=A0AAP2CR09_9RHOB|nr:hypothetical protein [Harenicola maris]